MIITLVTDQFYKNNNGTSVSSQQLCRELLKEGHTVRILTVDEENQTQYALHERNFGVFNKLIHSQGMQLAKPDNKVIKQAILGADIVHIFTPFKLGSRTIKLCRKLHIPFTVASHILPENITSSILLKNSKIVNRAIWRVWRKSIYKKAQHIHCPSTMVAKQLEKHKIKSNLHVISNGFPSDYQMQIEEKPKIFQDKIIIVATGRFSREKRYDLIFKAVKKSKNADKILLILGGKGPLLKKFEKKGRKLPNMPVFLGKYQREQQLSFLNFADMYIHAADIEVEGMTCLEAAACGCLPIVSNSSRSAAKQFVLHPQCLFKHGRAKDLASKIDWWIDNPDKLSQEKKKIAAHAQNFTLARSMSLYRKMFQSAIDEHKKQA